MLNDEDKRRIEEEERHRAAIRAQIASEGGGQNGQGIVRVQSAQKTTNLRESLDNIAFWLRIIFLSITVTVAVWLLL